MNRDQWEPRFEEFMRAQLADSAESDGAHDLAHVRRVVAAAVRLAAPENADLAVVLPAAWLHDCVIVPKDSPMRRFASRLAAEKACDFLTAAGYPKPLIDPIKHAIAAHSFSAGIAPQTVEARVVQDADRLDGLGAIGIARAVAVGTVLGRALYDSAEPFPTQRPPDDAVSTVDHFYTKLLRLAETMQTDAGRAEAHRRTAFMRAYLDQLADELGRSRPAPSP